MSAWEAFNPQRVGRGRPGPTVRLYVPKVGTMQIRIGRLGRTHLGLASKTTDAYSLEARTYVKVEVDRESGDMRLSKSNPAEGRLLNHRNGNLAVSRRFLEWTGWSGECTWDEYDLSTPEVIVCRSRREIPKLEAGAS